MLKGYEDKVKEYIERAKEEPSDTLLYEEGLEIGLMVGETEDTKQRIVERITSHIEIELGKTDKKQEVVKGLVTCLKEALSLEGELELDPYVIKTPVDFIVKLEDGSGVPLNMVGSETTYTREWLMPEILVFDTGLLEFAIKV